MLKAATQVFKYEHCSGILSVLVLYSVPHMIVALTVYVQISQKVKRQWKQMQGGFITPRRN